MLVAVLRCWVVMLCVWGSKREQCCLLCSLPVFSHFPHYSQSNWALLVMLPNVWVCVCSRSLWVSPMNSPVRLGVSPAAASTPTGVFNKRLRLYFPELEPWWLVCCPVHQLLPCPPHSIICCLAGSASHRPLCLAARLRPSYRSGWMSLLYLLGRHNSIEFNFLSVLVGFCF